MLLFIKIPRIKSRNIWQIDLFPEYFNLISFK